MKKLFGTFFFTLVVLIIGGILVIYANGTRLDRNGNLTSSGVLQIDTTPNSAEVFVDGENKGNSDVSIENLQPGIHQVRIEKDRYQTWSKEIEVKKGLVTPLFVNLFPSNPTLSPLTFGGVFSPQLSHNKKTIAYGMSSGNNKGIWILNLTPDRQLFFSNDPAPKQIAADTSSISFSKASLTWSPDNEQILATVNDTTTKTSRSFLLETNGLNRNPQILQTSVKDLTDSWEKVLLEDQKEILGKLGTKAVEIASGAKSISFSSDEKAVLIVKKDGSALVFDTKPSPLPNTEAVSYKLPSASNYFWLNGTSKNLVLVAEKEISITDTDGSNRVNLFSGEFNPEAIYSYPNGSKLVFSINFNPKVNSSPNLYSIDLN